MLGLLVIEVNKIVENIITQRRSGATFFESAVFIVAPLRDISLY
jgi:hypothetical protein